MTKQRFDSLKYFTENKCLKVFHFCNGKPIPEEARRDIVKKNKEYAKACKYYDKVKKRCKHPEHPDNIGGTKN